VSHGSAVVIAEAKGEPILKTTPEDSRVLCSCLAALSTTWKYLPHVSVRGRGFSFNIISTPHRLSFTCPPAFPLHHSFRTSSPPRRAPPPPPPPYHAFICLWASYGQLKVGAIMAYEDVDMHNLTLLVGTSLSHPRAKEATHTAQATPTDGYSLQAAAVGTL
jgi:hypothetical protein